jgi:hypothetical protein
LFDRQASDTYGWCAEKWARKKHGFIRNGGDGRGVDIMLAEDFLPYVRPVSGLDECVMQVFPYFQFDERTLFGLTKMI